MKRIVISVLCGVLLPALYTIVAVFITASFPDLVSDTVVVYGKAAPGSIFAPTLFTIYVYFWLESHLFFGWDRVMNTVWFRATFILLPIAAVYGLITYGLLHLFGFPKLRHVVGELGPPPPPDDLVSSERSRG